MNTYAKLGAGLAAAVLALTIGVGVYAMGGGGDADTAGSETGQQRDADKRAPSDGEGEDIAGICLAGDTDCVDTFDGPAGTCLEGDTDCNDTVGGAAGTCLEGTTDCVDTDLGGFNQCAPDYPDCTDIAVVETCTDDGVCTAMPCDSLPNTPCAAPTPCKAIIAEDGTVVDCIAPDVTCVEPLPAESTEGTSSSSSGDIDEAPAGEPGQSEPGDPGQADPPAPGQIDPAPPTAGCLPTPCAVPPDVSGEEAGAIARRCDEIQGGGSSGSEGTGVAEEPPAQR